MICSFVLPRHMLLQIAEALPNEMQGILALCNPIPSLLKTELLTVHNIVRAAKCEALIKVTITNYCVEGKLLSTPSLPMGLLLPEVRGC